MLRNPEGLNSRKKRAPPSEQRLVSLPTASELGVRGGRAFSGEKPAERLVPMWASRTNWNLEELEKLGRVLLHGTLLGD